MLASNITRALLLCEVRPKGPGSLFTGIYVLELVYWYMHAGTSLLNKCFLASMVDSTVQRSQWVGQHMVNIVKLE